MAAAMELRAAFDYDAGKRTLARSDLFADGVSSMTTLDFEPLTVAVPIREEPSGVFRVGKSRVLLELVLRAFQAGATPEAIVQSYDTLKLADVYAVISRYLAAPAPFEDYLRQCDEAAV